MKYRELNVKYWELIKTAPYDEIIMLANFENKKLKWAASGKKEKIKGSKVPEYSINVFNAQNRHDWTEISHPTHWRKMYE